MVGAGPSYRAAPPNAPGRADDASPLAVAADRLGRGIHTGEDDCRPVGVVGTRRLLGVQSPGLVVLYRWRLAPGHEDRFVEAWSTVTKALLERGSLGSRLHLGEDGLWYGYAQWPDAATRSNAFVAPLGVEQAQAAMAAAVEERFPELLLYPVDDLASRGGFVRVMRVARPTTDIARSLAFWTEIVGLDVRSRFDDHNGYDGIILGDGDGSWELELTRHRSGEPLPTPTGEDIAALYSSRPDAEALVARLADAGHPPHEHANPYWATMNASVHTDPDGYTLIVFPTD